MTKRKKSSSDSSGVMVIALILIIFITPIILFIVLVYSLCKFFKNTKHFRPLKGTYDDFWLDSRTIDTWKFYDEIWRINHHKLRNIEETVKELDISVNKDGSISTRSKAGKKLKADFDEATLEKNNAWDQLYELIYLPQERWKSVNKSLQYSIASFLGLVIYGLGYVYLQLTYQVRIEWATLGANLDSLKELFHAVSKIEWLKFDGWYLFLLSIGVAIITALIAFIYSTPLNRITPYPPEVETDNVDLYEGKY